MTILLALTSGDPAGVGLEITAKAWQSRQGLPPFFLLADPKHVAEVTDVPIATIETPEEATSEFDAALPVLPISFDAPVVKGNPALENASGTIRSIDAAVGFARIGRVSAVVTNPINKKVLYDGAGFKWPGHTEYLAHLGGVDRTVMMLSAPGLRVVPITIHIPLADVSKLLTPEQISATAKIVNKALVRDCGIAAPRIAVSGLNPHAGEGGAMGTEELEIITPTIDALQREGIDVFGPLPADTMFHAAARRKYDVALTMYHDQGLVAIKTLDFERGVNVTLGLPFVRTSPDHGTAYDIAGTGAANPTSLTEAIRTAGEMAAMRHQ